MVAQVSPEVSPEATKVLEEAGWEVYHLDAVLQRSPRKNHPLNHTKNFTKFFMWTLVEFDQILFIDADAFLLCDVYSDDLLLRKLRSPTNIAALNPTRSKTSKVINTGVMVLRPAWETFEALVKIFESNRYRYYTGGDQDVLNQYLREKKITVEWLTPKYNSRTRGHDVSVTDKCVIHFAGWQKPWLRPRPLPLDAYAVQPLPLPLPHGGTYGSDALRRLAANAFYSDDAVDLWWTLLALAQGDVHSFSLLELLERRPT
eukprot:TRINITY_DN4965_c0_g1_i2.p1 TRINITY_DN4965_c0_g1~~TRINITY_DN4965_c0_g1_i2.p1  ORF type:complete len:259 (+),score=77.11 TRINITY_DN4965_c0_g1_i2:574-1350(+)